MKTRAKRDLIRLLALVVPALLLGGCGEPVPPDAGTPAVDGSVPEVDGGAPFDAGVDDAGLDAGHDAGVATDAGVDAGVDAGSFDLDHDGYTAAQGDCDEQDALVNPGRPDLPDLAAQDTNCDGRDAVVGQDMYVEPRMTTAELQATLDGCAARTGCSVLFARGAYELTAPLTVREGARLQGGYARDFRSRDVTRVTDSVRATELRGGATQREAMIIDGQRGPIVLVGLRIVGPVQPLTGAAPSESVALWIHESQDVRISHSRIIGGRGGAGRAAAAPAANGAAGGAANGSLAGHGEPYAGAFARSHLFGISFLAVGLGCSYYGGSSGLGGLDGNGPRPGLARNASADPASVFVCTENTIWCDAAKRAPMRNTLNATNSLTDGYQDGKEGDCGAAGAPSAVSIGTLSAEGRWLAPAAGGGGGDGTPGSGGASGTLGTFFAVRDANSKQVICIQSAGDAGGGGGGGGVGVGGGGGESGRASLALVVVNSTLDVSDVEVVTGTGGAGAPGQAAGSGGNGGAAGIPGARVTQEGCTYSNNGPWPWDCPSPDWNKAPVSSFGGKGGPGGGGGGGAGGNGGPAIGLVVKGSALTAEGFHVDATQGSGGAGGPGGAGGRIGTTTGAVQCSAGREGVAGVKVDVQML